MSSSNDLMLRQISDTLNLSPEEMASLKKWFDWFIQPPSNKISDQAAPDIRKRLKLPVKT